MWLTCKHLLFITSSHYSACVLSEGARLGRQFLLCLVSHSLISDWFTQTVVSAVLHIHFQPIHFFRSTVVVAIAFTVNIWCGNKWSGETCVPRFFIVRSVLIMWLESYQNSIDLNVEFKVVPSDFLNGPTQPSLVRGTTILFTLFGWSPSFSYSSHICVSCRVQWSVNKKPSRPLFPLRLHDRNKAFLSMHCAVHRVLPWGKVTVQHLAFTCKPPSCPLPSSSHSYQSQPHSLSFLFFVFLDFTSHRAELEGRANADRQLHNTQGQYRVEWWEHGRSNSLSSHRGKYRTRRFSAPMEIWHDLDDRLRCGVCVRHDPSGDRGMYVSVAAPMMMSPNRREFL